MNIPLDKQAHFLAGYGIALTFAIAINPITGGAIGILAGAAKEIIWDRTMSCGEPDGLDFMATAAGSVIGAVASVMLMRIVSQG